MSNMYIILILIPISYALTLALEYAMDKLLRSKTAEFVEWEMTYEAPVCSRRVLLPLVFLCLAAGTLYPATLKGQVLSCLLLVQLLVVCLIDYKYQFIFDEQNILLAATGLLRMCDFPSLWKEPLLACVGAFVVMFVLAIISRGAMGGGDVKLMAALGLWLGVWGIMQTFFYGVVAGGIGGVIMLIASSKGRKDFFAYGPYLCLGAVYVWYLSGKTW